MDARQKQAEEAEKNCDAQVQARLQKGIWVSSREWIAMRDIEKKKAQETAEILASFW